MIESLHLIILMFRQFQFFFLVVMLFMVVAEQIVTHQGS